MPGGMVHGPGPLDEIRDCLAYAQAVHQGDDESALAASDVLHLRLAGRADAMVAPPRLARLILDGNGGPVRRVIDPDRPVTRTPVARSVCYLGLPPGRSRWRWGCSRPAIWAS